jgi:MtN3 and saliva related transmembrane protein
MSSDTDNKDALGYIGMVFLTITLIPQLIKVYKTKKANDLSYIFIFMNFLTCMCFLSYGIILNETPLIIANTIVLFQTAILTFLKFRYTNNAILRDEY